MSNRAEEWKKFSDAVLEHIETYTVPQYGDAPHDQASTFSKEFIACNIQRYINRVDTNQRGPAERKRDAYKIAHYACILASLIDKEQ